MSQSEEPLVENEPNNISDLPKKKFNITMEISLFIIMFSYSLTDVAITNIVLYRTCMHSLDHTREDCQVFLSLDKNNQTQRLEKEVQKYVTYVRTVRSVIQSLTPAVLSLFLGVWSDTHGRKPLVVWPLFGMAISGIFHVVYSMLDDLGPWWYILTVIPTSLSGGMTILFTAAYCYISDITSSEKRSMRMTILDASVSAGGIVGSLLSAHVLRAVGNVYLLLIGTALNVFAYAFTNIFMTESLTGAAEGGLSSVLDFSLVKEMIRECFKKQINNGRAQILLLITANTLSIFLIYGLYGLDYLYVRTKLSWALKDFTLYTAVNTSISFLGGLLGVIVVQRMFRLSDLMFTNIAFMSALTEYIIKALAASTWYMYLGAALSLFKGLSTPLLRSILSKILPLEDIAKVFALMSVAEALCPLISHVLYNFVYQCTLLTLPSTIYIMSSGVMGICIILVGIVQYYRWNCEQYERLESEAEA